MFSGYYRPDPTLETSTYCTNCGAENPEIIKNAYGHKGCNCCMTYCPVCREWEFNDSTEFVEMEILKDSIWQKAQVCRNCESCYQDDPEYYPELR